MTSAVIDITRQRDRRAVRRHALAALGLLHRQPFGRGLGGTAKAFGHLGYVQIDSISVVERAHHHVLHSRVPGFEPSMIDRLLHRREIFEYWSHAAAFLPMSDFRYSLPYKDAINRGQVHWNRNPDTKLMNELLARVRSEGPLKSRDLDNPSTRREGWWDWKPAKKALEQLYMRGDLMVSDREGFQKTYDLAERVLPADVDCSMPSLEEQAAYLLDQQLRSHAFVTLKGVTYLRKGAPLRAAVKALVDARLAAGELEQVRVDGTVFLCQAGLLQRPMPRAAQRLSILSPFDHGVIQRERLEALFGFQYQLECYLPEGRRRYGYFSLPLLYRDRFVGRMDCKVHRKARRLEIRTLHFEPQGVDDEALMAAFCEALEAFMAFQGCDTVSVGRVEPVEAAQRVASALRQRF
ncbi:winged helix-turn-helix domain-containing protein [Marinihelvus fidelis]|uniref:Winged helix-turn-helix domain-containing protein n=1 Tax=Marinihelvus fidelis TaxID=2613842 RepID=A0A5N0TC41_9GAMM|nr:crosslink repair DNA glycosylase YcaQ family protein [Marinihelvus fidelis]KAA9132530.1 winged helix-turn-helix domain-containing protein [Marinihelvus fidelis]